MILISESDYSKNYQVLTILLHIQELHVTNAGADPGFPVGWGANPSGGTPTYDLPNFAKNCMKLRKFWTVGRRTPGAAPKSVTKMTEATLIHK